MHPEEQNDLKTILEAFGAEELGNGNPIVGANALAAMACVLADLAPADGTLRTKDGRQPRLGTSLLVSGGASVGKITDEILAEVLLRQDNLRAHLRRYAVKESLLEKGKRPLPTGPGDDSIEQRFVSLQESNPFAFGGAGGSWSAVLREPPAETVHELMIRQKLLVSAHSPKALERQLEGIRPGRLLAHLGISRPSDFTGFAELGGALADGTCMTGQFGETIRANLVITDPLRMLDEAARDPDESTAWLRRAVLLTDADTGPHAPEGLEPAKPGTEKEIWQKFGGALDRVLTLRMNHSRKSIQEADAETDGARRRWGRFLREMEPRLPGISGAARNLLSSLSFGLCQLFGISMNPGSMKRVEALARFLVRRMAGARAAMLCNGDVARRQSQIRRVFRQLGDGPAEMRTIYRNLSLSAAECEECLRWLESAKLARCFRRKWQQLEGARLNFAASEMPVLEA